MRKNLIERNVPSEWNVRVLTEDHFWDYCAARRITVRIVPLEQPGYSLVRKVDARIYIHDELRGAERLYTMFHELGHHWIHARGIQFFMGCKSRIEMEAEVIAACALIPRTILPPRFGWSEVQELYGYPDWMISFRNLVFRKYGL